MFSSNCASVKETSSLKSRFWSRFSFLQNFCARFLVLTLSLFLIGSCNVNNAQQQTMPEPYVFELSPRAAEVIQESNRFGVSFYMEASKNSAHSNLMLSPLSASVALTMLLNGADGDTYSQLSQMLGYPATLEITDINNIYRELITQLYKADDTVKLSMANSIFYHQNFDVKSEYIAAMKQGFVALAQLHQNLKNQASFHLSCVR
ncbi:MAG: hypothetical protein LAT67_12950 [Balneolales bacterium]|nr:hypothetical protein [Balneolales bacterium]